MAFGWQAINFDKFKPVMLAALRSLNLAIKFDVWHILAFSLVQPIDDAPGIYLRSCKELWFEWIDLFFPSQYFSSAWRCLFILERSTKVGYHESSLYKCVFYIYIYITLGACLRQFRKNYVRAWRNGECEHLKEWHGESNVSPRSKNLSLWFWCLLVHKAIMK